MNYITYNYDDFEICDAFLLTYSKYPYYKQYSYSKPLTEEIIVDYDINNKIIGVEVLDASQTLKMSKKQLKMKLEMKI